MDMIEISSPEKQGRLLILDDDVDVGKTIGMIAQRVRFDVRICQHVKAFFDTLVSWKPTHIALDLVMPSMDGIEVLRDLAERNCHAGIIVTSGLGEKVLESARRSSMARGLNVIGVLPKPFNVELLRKILLAGVEINSALERRRGSRSPISLERGDLEIAFRENQLLLHYQPKVAACDGRIFGVEALVRWQHPSLGMISPDSFIPFAERTGQIDALTQKVFDIGLPWLRRIRERRDDIMLEFNVSARSLGDIAFADALERQCVACGVPTHAVVLEITETSKLCDINEAGDVLSRLRIKGFGLAIDDYGVGYSSMGQLADLPFTEVKIDKSFVSSVMHSRERRMMVDSTLILAKSLGVAAVAEGVEDFDTLQMLSEMGCPFVQGYFIAPPMEPKSAEEWLTQH